MRKKVCHLPRLFCAALGWSHAHTAATSRRKTSSPPRKLHKHRISRRTYQYRKVLQRLGTFTPRISLAEGGLCADANTNITPKNHRNNTAVSHSSFRSLISAPFSFALLSPFPSFRILSVSLQLLLLKSMMGSHSRTIATVSHARGAVAARAAHRPPVPSLPGSVSQV